jgi:hypothetical protein
MNIYVLEPISIGKGTPWDPWYDKTFKVIVCAKDETEARELANEEGGNENGHWMGGDEERSVWKDEKLTICEIYEPTESEVIVSDHRSA